MSAPRTVAEHVLDRLAAWGVHRFYGYPGDGIGGIFTALPHREELGGRPFGDGTPPGPVPAEEQVPSLAGT